MPQFPKRMGSGVYKIGDRVLVKSKMPDGPTEPGTIKYFSKVGLTAYVHKDGRKNVTACWLEQLELIDENEDLLQRGGEQIQSGDSAPKPSQPDDHLLGQPRKETTNRQVSESTQTTEEKR